MPTAGTSWPLAILGIIAVVAIFAFLTWMAYAIRAVRREMDEAGWGIVRAKLKGLSLGERFEVFRAVRFGRAVRDPALANVAIAKAAYLQEFLSATTMIRRIRRLFVLMGVTELA